MVRNLIYRVDGPRPFGGATADPLGDYRSRIGLSDLGKLDEVNNNVLVWNGTAQHGSYSSLWGSAPAGWTVTSNLSVWTNAVAAWKTAHPSVQRIPGIDTFTALTPQENRDLLGETHGDRMLDVVSKGLGIRVETAKRWLKGWIPESRYPVTFPTWTPAARTL